jgi:hypothetical protein
LPQTRARHTGKRSRGFLGTYKAQGCTASSFKQKVMTLDFKDIRMLTELGTQGQEEAQVAARF